MKLIGYLEFRRMFSEGSVYFAVFKRHFVLDCHNSSITQ